MSQIKEQNATYELADLSPVLKAANSGVTLLENLPVWLSAQTRKSAGRGRSADNTLQYGVQKLRELILELAVRGKLTPQDPNDEPASILLEKITEEKARQLNEEKLKKQNSEPNYTGSEIPFSPPQNWSWVKLGDVVEVLDSLRKPITKTSRKEGPYPYYGASGIVDYVADFIFDEPLVLVGEDGAKWGRGEQTAFSISGKTWVNNHAHVLRTKDLVINQAYLVYYLTACDLIEYITGMTVPKLNQKRLVAIPVPLPPLAEQHRIVTKVDELMALCDQLEQQQTDAVQAHDFLVKVLLDTLTQSENAEDFQQNWRRIAEHFDTLFNTESSIDQLKQTLLQLAVMGKLVPQDPNDEPASVLLEKIDEEKERLIKEGKIKKQQSLPLIEDKPFGIPINWQFSYLQNICSLITDGTHQTPTYTESGRPFVSAQCVKPFLFIPENCRYVSEEHYQEYVKNRKPEKDDILLSRVGAGIGEAAIIDTDLEFAIYVSTALLKPFMQYVTPRYLLIWLNSPTGRYASTSKTLGKGVSQGNLNLSLIRSFIVSIPPTAEQHRIVKKVDELMVICDQLKDHLNQAQTIQQKLADTIVCESIR